jgi:predicted nucleic acid-binding protein
VQARLAAVQATSDRVIICPIVRGEIIYGISRLPDGKKRRELSARSAQFFAMIPCEPIAPDAADQYARIKLESQQSGHAIGDNDLWIAATTLTLNAVFVTRDNDFRHIAGLIVEDWIS